MNFHLEQPLALLATVAFLALPLQRSSIQQLPSDMNRVMQVPTTSPSEAALPVVPATPNQSALARYIAVRYDKPLSYTTSIVRTTFEEAGKYALPPGLLLGMMEKESGFNAAATSSYGAMGLMQVVPRFHMERLKKNETESSLRNPRTNIRVAAHILAEYLATHKDLDKALRKYSGASHGYSRQVRSNWHEFNKVGQQLTPPRKNIR